MSLGTLVLATLCAGLFLGSGAVVSVTVKRVYFAEWRGGIAAVSLALIGICWALALGQLVGAFGWLRAAPLLGSAVASAALAVLLGRRAQPPGPTDAPAGDPEPEAAPQQALFVATVLLVLVVAAIWTTRTFLTVRRGIYDPDSVGYHLPFAATFAQTGHADPTRFPYPASPVQLFPANDELLVAIALVLTKSFVLAAVKNLLFGALVLLAAHSIGKALKAAWLSVAGTAIVLALQNRVVTLTRDRSVDGGPVAHDSCPEWMQALAEGQIPYAAVMSGTKWQQWVEADPAFELEVQNEPPQLYRVAVYRVVGDPDARCAGTG